MGLLIWKIIRNILFYGLLILVVTWSAYTWVIWWIYSVMVGTYTGILNFIWRDFTNLLFWVLGIVIIFSVINMFRERN